jgi:NAD dependent epimerase/dehydratase family enzyme
VDDADVVVNLAGESIASGRWTGERKRRLVESRLDATRGLVRALSASAPRSRAFVSASAIGYYGSRGDDRSLRTHRPARFSHVCVDWGGGQWGQFEHRRVACPASSSRGWRRAREDAVAVQAVRRRPDGPGAAYAGFTDDWLALMRYSSRAHAGAFNATAPALVTNTEFSGDLTAMGRPAAVPTPHCAAPRTGQMADAPCFPELLGTRLAAPSIPVHRAYRRARCAGC